MPAAEVVRVFQDPAANPRGAQLIFTTHDATLLGDAVLDRPRDRDQVWITTGKRSGETELYPLTEAKPRKEENLERGHLRGRYGGVPHVTAGQIVREPIWQETKAMIWAEGYKRTEPAQSKNALIWQTSPHRALFHPKFQIRNSDQVTRRSPDRADRDVLQAISAVQPLRPDPTGRGEKFA